MPEVGERLSDKYLLERKLGEGGMGAVFEAVHEQIGKRVAIKCLHAALAGDRRLVARFQQEAQAAAAVGHRGIVEIFDLGVAADGSPFLVMELLPGEALSAQLERQGRLDVDDAAYVACQVLSALFAVHRAGIVHRDLKPDNVFLVDTGAALADVKLLDFGISRVVGAGGQDAATRMTQAGAVMGTPSYMSPEQCKGELDVDHRTDVYAMGVILYRALTGALPFEAANYNALMQRIIAGGPRPPRELRPDLPAPLEAAILRAMSSARDARHPDADELFQDVLPFVDERAAARVSMPTRGGGSAAIPSVQGAAEAPTQPSGDVLPAIAAAAEAPTMASGQGQTPDGAGELPGTLPATSTPVPPTQVALPPTQVAALRASPPRESPRRGAIIALLVVLLLAVAGAGTYLLLAAPGAPSSSVVPVTGEGTVVAPAVETDATTGAPAPTETSDGAVATPFRADAAPTEGDAAPPRRVTKGWRRTRPTERVEPESKAPPSGAGGTYGREVDGPASSYGREVD